MSRAVVSTRRVLVQSFIVLSWLLTCATAAADELSNCKTGSLQDLKAAMKAHNEHVYRMNRKFKDVWYFQGDVPPSVGSEVTVESIHRYLQRLAPRKTGLLFHAVDEDRLCTWLFTSVRSEVVQHRRILPPAAMNDLNPSRWQELGVRTARRPRIADGARPGAPLDAAESTQRWDELLRRVGDVLLPPSVSQRLVGDGIDTLIVVPISIRSFLYRREEPDDSATRLRHARTLSEVPAPTHLVLAVSTVPFLALPLAGSQLVDRMSVIVAPGFHAFATEPAAGRGAIGAALVVGAPIRKGLEALPGAQAEVERIAADLQVEPLIGAQALKQRVLGELARRAHALDFILFATHGRASETDPVDQSYLEFSDGRLSAREISALRQGPAGGGRAVDSVRLRQRPVVVMSACETGLGKDFAVGTIGLARAWQWAGASSVVMSLWSVDDDATRDLMVDLVGELRAGRAADVALREAAIKARRADGNPALWAGFNVFGAPERLRPR